VVKHWQSGPAPLAEHWTLASDTRFLYDGWNLIAEFEMNQQSGIMNLKSTHAWGLDLSGTEQGAGGIGGLTLTQLHSQPSAQTTLAPCYDANGNLLCYVDCASGQVQARYEYDPFGRVILKEETPAVAGRLHHQFSTKYRDDETGLSYCGYRYYDPETGRWLSRDPIGERGGVNLYGMVGNDPVNHYDVLGLRSRGFGAGQLTVDSSCSRCKDELADYGFLSEDPPYTLRTLPPPGSTVDADALYYPGGAKKISDNASITLTCDDCCNVTESYSRWPWWIGSGSEWPYDDKGGKPGPKPPDWPGDYPPYPTGGSPLDNGPLPAHDTPLR
jgi:RHS repeat-associated protein